MGVTRSVLLVVTGLVPKELWVEELGWVGGSHFGVCPFVRVPNSGSGCCLYPVDTGWGCDPTETRFGLLPVPGRHRLGV